MGLFCMTNELLAMRIRDGDKASYEMLYNGVSRLLNQMALSFFLRNENRCSACGVTLDDLRQTAFFALPMAIKAFNPDKGLTFTAYLSFPIKKLFSAAIGFRTAINPLDLTVDSKVISDNGEEADILDFTPDKAAEEAFKAIEASIYQDGLHQALNAALSEIPTAAAEVIRMHYLAGKTLGTIANESGEDLDSVQKLSRKGMAELRKAKAKKHIMAFFDEVVSEKAYNGVGFSAWKAYGSVPERLVEAVERRGD